MNYASPVAGLYVYRGTVEINGREIENPILDVQGHRLYFGGESAGHVWSYSTALDDFVSVAVSTASSDVTPVLQNIIDEYNIQLEPNTRVDATPTKENILGRVG